MTSAASPTSPPRTVQVAFWCWVVAAALLLLGGLLEMTLVGFGDLRNAYPASVPDSDIRSLLTYYRGVATVCMVLGLAIGYFAGRTRRGDKRFRRASVALSVAGVVLLLAAKVLLGGVSLLAVLAVIPLLVAVVSATRDSSSAWFDAVESGSDGD